MSEKSKKVISIVTDVLLWTTAATTIGLFVWCVLKIFGAVE